LKVLVTGGLGFLGSNLAIRLVNLGARVLVVDGLIEGCGANLYNLAPVENRVRILRRNIAEARHFRKALSATEIIFNLAGEISHSHSMRFPQRDAELNAWAQLRFLEECVRAAEGIRIVYAGTRQIYGAPRYLPVDEDHPIAPLDFNGIHNYAATRYHTLFAHTGKLDALTVNFTNLYGPRMALARPCQGFLGTFIRKMMTGGSIEIYGDGSQLRDPLYVDDAVDALLKAGVVERPTALMYNVGGPEPLSVGRIAEYVTQLSGAGQPVYRPFPLEQKQIDIGSYYADWTRIQQDMGWTPTVRFEDGLKRTFDYYAAELSHYLDPPLSDPPCSFASHRKRAKVMA
jgi:nucleoside-diphosphate-sugar epimerase